MRNKTKPLKNEKPNYPFQSKPRILTRWWHFPDNIEKTQAKEAQEKRTCQFMKLLAREKRPLSTKSTASSKLMCKPITSRTASVIRVSSACKTIPTTAQKHVLLNPLPSDLLWDQTSIPLSRKPRQPLSPFPTPPLINTWFLNSISLPKIRTMVSFPNGFWQKKLCLSHPNNHLRVCVKLSTNRCDKPLTMNITNPTQIASDK